jgi:hypothetical protein
MLLHRKKGRSHIAAIAPQCQHSNVEILQQVAGKKTATKLAAVAVVFPKAFHNGERQYRMVLSGDDSIIQVQGVGTNQNCQVTIWPFDSSNTGNRISLAWP